MGCDSVHLRIIPDAPRESVSQDIALEDERLRRFATAICDTLPRKAFAPTR